MAVPEMYMQKMIVAGQAAAAIDIDAPVVDNVKAVAAALGRRPEDLRVLVLDRARHEDLIAQIRRSGARLTLIEDGDVSAGIAAAVQDAGVDMYIGIGGSTEGIITAAALRCLGGEIQARFWPVSRYQVEQVRAAGIENVEAAVDHQRHGGRGRGLRRDRGDEMSVLAGDRRAFRWERTPRPWCCVRAATRYEW